MLEIKRDRFLAENSPTAVVIPNCPPYARGPIVGWETHSDIHIVRLAVGEPPEFVRRLLELAAIVQRRDLARRKGRGQRDLECL